MGAFVLGLHAGDPPAMVAPGSMANGLHAIGRSRRTPVPQRLPRRQSVAMRIASPETIVPQEFLAYAA
jgi:hypothetical protein